MNMPIEERHQVMIVDDTPANLAFLSDALADAGYEVLVALSGHTALRQLELVKPDVILLPLSARDFIKTLPLNASAERAAAHVQSVVQDLSALWKRGRDLGALVIQQSFLDVTEPLFGGLDAIAPGAPSRLIAQINMTLADAASADGVLWLDAARESARDGLAAWHGSAGQLHTVLPEAHLQPTAPGLRVAALGRHVDEDR